MSRLDFGGRVAIVTGAGRGIGRAHAIMLASRGARVVVNDLLPVSGNENPAREVAAEIRATGGIAVPNHDSVVGGAGALVRQAVEEFGGIDILVNNAGVLSGTAFADTPAEDWHDVFDVHFRGTVEVCRAAWPWLRRSGSARIVNTASSGMLGNAGLTSYGAAKAAIFGFTRSLAVEGQADGILANTILPSARTRITAEIDDPGVQATLQRFFQPDHVAALVAWLVHQDTHVTNEVFQVSGGRAGRLAMAMMPTVRVEDSTPEAWVQHCARLLADGPLSALVSTAQMFAHELADADPSVHHAMDAATGGLAIRPVTGREG